MRFMLELIGMSLIAAVFLSADGARDMRIWLAGAFLGIGAAALLLIIADLIPDRPWRRRKMYRRRVKDATPYKGGARAVRPAGRNNARREQVTTLQPKDEEETVWF